MLSIVYSRVLPWPEVNESTLSTCKTCTQGFGFWKRGYVRGLFRLVLMSIFVPYMTELHSIVHEWHCLSTTQGSGERFLGVVK